MSEENLRALYDAACRADQLFVRNRSFEDWLNKVSDAGLAAARCALEAESDVERRRLKESVIEAARQWPANYEREELLNDVIALRLFDAVEALSKFEVAPRQHDDSRQV